MITTFTKYVMLLPFFGDQAENAKSLNEDLIVCGRELPKKGMARPTSKVEITSAVLIQIA